MIFVTGGTGLVGAHLLFDLTSAGNSVRALKRQSSDISRTEKIFSYYSDDSAALMRKIEWVDGDLSDIYNLLDILEGITEIYHCAAVVSFEKAKVAEMQLINSEGTANLVNAAAEKNIRKFCHMSSIAALGKTEHGEMITETSFWKSSPENSAYSVSKYSAEREVWRASEEGLPVIIVNPSLIIGPGNWNQSTANMFTKAYKGIRFYTEGTNGFVDVRDVTALMIRLMQSEIVNERFILNGENASFRRFFDLVHRCFDKRIPSVKAGRYLSGFAWRMDKIRSMLTGGSPLITPETARAAHKKSSFSNKKILDVFPDFRFRILEDVVQHTCQVFHRDH